MGLSASSYWSTLRSACVLLALLLVPLPAAAFDESMRPLLRQLSQEGVNAYLAKDYPNAVDKLERAWSMLPTAPIGLWSARALEKSGRLVAASERYLAATRAPLDKRGEKTAQEKAKDEAATERQELALRIPTLRIDVQGANPKEIVLSVAGSTVPADFIGVALPVDPGKVRVIASVGDVVEEGSVELGEGETGQITLDFGNRLLDAPRAEPIAKPVQGTNDDTRKSTWQKPVGWLGIGLGGAGLAIGAASGIVLMDKYGALGCTASMNCVASEDEATSLNTWRTVSTVSLIAGGVLAAAGVTLVVTAPKARSGASVSAYLTGAEAGIAGTF